MPTTDTTVSRLQLAHPDLDHDGGSTLHTKVRNAWTKIGDNMNSRFFTEDALADSSFVDFEHNFKTAFNEIRVNLYDRDTGTGELTRIESGGTPDLDDFTIEATPGSLTTSVRITNNTGSAQDIAAVVNHGKSAGELDVEWTGYTKFVGGTHPDAYATLAAAIAASSAGDSILVMESYSVSVAETLSVNDVKITFMPNVFITITAAVYGLIVSASRCEIVGAKYIGNFSGTIPAFAQISGDDNEIRGLQGELNNAGLTVTQGIDFTGASQRNYMSAAIRATSGTLTTNVSDAGTDNDYSIRG